MSASVCILDFDGTLVPLFPRDAEGAAILLHDDCHSDYVDQMDTLLAVTLDLFTDVYIVTNGSNAWVDQILEHYLHPFMLTGIDVISARDTFSQVSDCHNTWKINTFNMIADKY